MNYYKPDHTYKKIYEEHEITMSRKSKNTNSYKKYCDYRFYLMKLMFENNFPTNIIQKASKFGQIDSKYN